VIYCSALVELVVVRRSTRRNRRKKMSEQTELAKLAGTSRLRGGVCVTDAKGVTHSYDDEAAAAAVWDSKVGRMEHRRGGFFERAGAAPAAPVAPVVVLDQDSDDEPPRRSKKKSSRRR